MASPTVPKEQPGTARLYICPQGGFAHGYSSVEPFICNGDHHEPVEAVPVAVQALSEGDRSLAEIRNWISERRDHERRNEPSNPNTPAGGMTMGALETLNDLTAFLNGEDGS